MWMSENLKRKMFIREQRTPVRTPRLQPVVVRWIPLESSIPSFAVSLFSGGRIREAGVRFQTGSAYTANATPKRLAISFSPQESWQPWLWRLL